MQVSSFRGIMMAFQDTEVGMRILVIAALLITLAGWLRQQRNAD